MYSGWSGKGNVTLQVSRLTRFELQETEISFFIPLFQVINSAKCVHFRVYILNLKILSVVSPSDLEESTFQILVYVCSNLSLYGLQSLK